MTVLRIRIDDSKSKVNMHNASVTHSRLWLPFEIRQRYDTKSEKVGLLSSMIGNVLSLSERSRIRS